MLFLGMASNDDSPINVNWDALRRVFGIKMGPGIMGRSTQLSALLIALALFGAWLFRGSGWAPAAFFVPLLLIVYVVRRAFNFIEKHPEQALLESSELLRKAELDQAAKQSDIIDVEATPVENTNPPAAITKEGGSDA